MVASSPDVTKKAFLHRAITCCLIQGLLQLAAALIGIQIFENQINTCPIRWYNDNFTWTETIAFMTWRTYFRDNCTFGYQENGWLCTAPAAPRTHFWTIYYSIVCTIWVMTSLLLLVLAPENKKLNLFCRVYRYWWIIVTTLVIFSDALASIQYLVDLRHMSNEDEYFDFIGFNSNDTIPVGSVPPCMRTAYVYVPSVLMSLIFSKGIVGWMLNVFLLISAIKHFQTPKLEPVADQVDENQYNGKEDSTPHEDATTSSTVTLSELTAATNPADENYVPWMNVLYLPSIYEESNNSDKMPEYYDEHHYEHVIGPGYDMPGGITIEIPPRTKNNANSANTADDQPNKVDPKLMKIDVGNICIQINHKNSRTNTSSTNYQNLKVLKIPRVTGVCSETDCNIHRSFNATSTQEDGTTG